MANYKIEKEITEHVKGLPFGDESKDIRDWGMKDVRLCRVSRIIHTGSTYYLYTKECTDVATIEDGIIMLIYQYNIVSVPCAVLNIVPDGYDIVDGNDVSFNEYSEAYGILVATAVGPSASFA